MAARWATLMVFALAGFSRNEAVASEIGEVYGTVTEDVAGAEADEVAPQVVLPLKLTMKTSAATSRNRILLKDIATCEGHAAACEELEAADMGPSPDPGRMRVLLLRDVKEAVSRETHHDISYAGAESMRVTAEARDVDAATIRQAIQTRLNLINQNLDHVEIKLKQALSLRLLKIRPGDYDITIPDWDAALEVSDGVSLVSDDWAAETLSGSVRLVVKVRPEGDERAEDVPVRLQLEAYRQVPVATRTIERGTVLTRGDLRLEKKRITPSSRLWVNDKQGLEGKVLRMPLRAGEVPTASMLATPLLVKRGETVELAIKAGGVALTGKGRARASGSLGDTVDVFYLATKKQLKGRVIGPSQVEVSF